MWAWVIGFVVIVGVIVVVVNRRGSTGSGRGHDVPSTGRADTREGGGYINPGGGGDAGGF
jgi:hypothetical protein